MKKTIYIIFLSLIFLTGCTMEDSPDKEDLIEEQFDIFNTKMFLLLEDVIGIKFSNYRLITIDVPKTDENKNKADQESKKQTNEIEITDIAYDNSLFEKGNEPDWEKAKQYIKELMDIYIDLEINLSDKIDPDLSSRYSEYMSSLVMSISEEDKKKTIIELNNIYDEAYTLYELEINDEHILEIEKMYYDVIRLLIKLEKEDKNEFEDILSTLKNDIKNIDIENGNYILLRCNVIINAIDYDKMADTRIKIAMLINSIPILEYNVSEA